MLLTQRSRACWHSSREPGFGAKWFSWQEKGRSRYADIGESFDAPDDHFDQTLKGAVVLARKFVVDLANIDILAAIASCLPTKTPARPGHVLSANTP